MRCFKTRHGLHAKLLEPPGHLARHRLGKDPLGSLCCQALGETDLTDVDADHQHVQDRPAPRTTCVGAPLSSQMNAVRHDVVGSELRCREPACNIDPVIMAPQSKVTIKEEILN